MKCDIKILNKAAGGLFVGTVILGVAMSAPGVFADTSRVSTAVVSIPSACSVAATVNSEHTATLLNGIYSGDDNYPNGIGSTTMKVVCNDASGFAIYAVGFSGDEYGVTNMLGTNTSATIPTGTATSGDNSQWAMKLAKVTDSTAYNPANLTITNNYDAYHVVPSDYEKVVSFSSATDQTLGSKFTLTYAAYVSATQAADAYVGKVKYTLVHPATNIPNKAYATIRNKIGYYPNAGNEVEDTMGDQSIYSDDTSAQLWASNFKRQGYGFAGWSDKYDWVLGANDMDGNGTGVNAGYHIYGPNQIIEFEAGQYSETDGGLSLYAVWVPSAGYLQNWTCPNNATMPIGTITALTDQRDGDTYAVAKLVDGKCWMIENLRLDDDARENTSGSLAQAYGGMFAGLANAESSNFTATNDSATDPTAPNSLYYAGTQVLPATINIIQDDYAGYRIPRYRNSNTNDDPNASVDNKTVDNMTGADQNVYSYGNYYNWPAAKANTSFMDDYAEYIAVETSICPAGWRLPRGGNKSHESNNEIWSLVVDGLNNGVKPANYNDEPSHPYYNELEEAGPVSNMIWGYPNNFVTSGYAQNDSISHRGDDSYIWLADASSRQYGYYFDFCDSYINPGTATSLKFRGLSVRCVLSPSS